MRLVRRRGRVALPLILAAPPDHHARGPAARPHRRRRRAVRDDASAWGSRENIAITAVLGIQFAAIAAVVAFVLFGERLARLQVVGVVVIAIGVTVLAFLQA